jgi:hypothetical protein
LIITVQLPADHPVAQAAGCGAGTFLTCANICQNFMAPSTATVYHADGTPGDLDCPRAQAATADPSRTPGAISPEVLPTLMRSARVPTDAEVDLERDDPALRLGDPSLAAPKHRDSEGGEGHRGHPWSATCEHVSCVRQDSRWGMPESPCPLLCRGSFRFGPPQLLLFFSRCRSQLLLHPLSQAPSAQWRRVCRRIRPHGRPRRLPRVSRPFRRPPWVVWRECRQQRVPASLTPWEAGPYPPVLLLPSRSLRWSPPFPLSARRRERPPSGHCSGLQASGLPLMCELVPGCRS